MEADQLPDPVLVAWNVGPIGIHDPVAMNGAGSNSVVWRAS